MSTSITWWDKFTHENYKDRQIIRIIDLINEAEMETSKDRVLEIGKLIRKLDQDKYASEITQLKKKHNILENRIERQISDDFGALLKYLRLKKNMSLAELGEKTGVSPSYINRLELRQRKSPSINIMESLANALEVPLSDLARAAGVGFDNSATKDLKSIINHSSISLEANGSEISSSEKRKLIELIDFISVGDWGKNRQEEVVSLIYLMDEFKKEVTKRKKKESIKEELENEFNTEFIN